MGDVEFKSLLKKAKLRLLRMHYESKVGHIGGNLSSLDAILYLHLFAMKNDDLFVLSKGHSAGALYVALWMAGKLDEGDLEKFHRDGTRIAGHPTGGWHPGIRFSTGSLGHGLGLSAGAALARKIKAAPGKVFCLLSDGEWNEGSNWEALIFLAHQKLDNLTLLIDANGLQGFGGTSEVATLEPLAEKFRTFALDVREVDGHDHAALALALAAQATLPKVIIMRTVKGKGVSFMENRMEWHYLPMTEEQYKKAVEEVTAP